MAKSDRVSVSKKELAESGEELTAVGELAEVAAVADLIEGAEDLEVARAAAAIGIEESGAGSSDMTRAVDAAIVAERMQQLSYIVDEAGVDDVAEGVDMLVAGGDVRVMGALVSLMSWDDLDRGMELARMAGEMSTVSNLADMMEMPVLADFLGLRGERLQELAIDQVLRAAGTRALAGAIDLSGADIEAMGENEIDEGLVRMAVADAAAERSDELAGASELLAGRGADELDTAAAAGALAREAARAGVGKIAAGAEEVGIGEMAVAAGEALQNRAN